LWNVITVESAKEVMSMKPSHGRLSQWQDVVM
jgi:hypothetical protein